VLAVWLDFLERLGLQEKVRFPSASWPNTNLSLNFSSFHIREDGDIATAQVHHELNSRQGLSIKAKDRSLLLAFSSIQTMAVASEYNMVQGIQDMTSNKYENFRSFCKLPQFRKMARQCNIDCDKS
jgi:hypothetical protein